MIKLLFLNMFNKSHKFGLRFPIKKNICLTYHLKVYYTFYLNLTKNSEINIKFMWKICGNINYIIIEHSPELTLQGLNHSGYKLFNFDINDFTPKGCDINIISNINLYVCLLFWRFFVLLILEDFLKILNFFSICK